MCRDASILYLYLFFSMIRRPPRSTLFPTRRSSDLSPGSAPIASTSHSEPVHLAMSGPEGSDGPGRSRHASAAGSYAAACIDRKSTRLNSSHGYISYAVFCLKKKKTKLQQRDHLRNV